MGILEGLAFRLMIANRPRVYPCPCGILYNLKEPGSSRRHLFNIVMTRIPNIFYRLVQYENAMTELFCNLMSFKLFRERILALFLDHDIDTVQYEDFSTQCSSDHGQPDMLIENDSLKYFIEIKTNTWTQLTANQPVGYLEELLNCPQKSKGLIFLVPKHYEHENQLRDDASNFLANISTPIDFKILYWDEIINAIEDSELDNINVIIGEFNSLLKTWYFEEEIFFEPTEVITMFSDQIPKNRKNLLKLKKIVDDIVGKSSAFNIDTPPSKTFLPDEYGIYYKNAKNQPVLFFGIWFDFWENTGKPLCFGVDIKKYPKNVVSTFRKKYSGKTKTLENWEITWFDEKDFLSSKIVEVIANELFQLVPALTGQE